MLTDLLTGEPIYQISLDNETDEIFSIVKYDRTDSDFKENFESKFPNIFALLKKANGKAELIELLIVDNPNDYFYFGVPYSDLDIVLVNKGSRPSSTMTDIKIFLEEKFKKIEKVFPKSIPFDKLGIKA